MLRCVIFDMDGTLLDTEVLSVAAWQEAGKAFGYEIPREFIIDYFGMSEAGVNRRYLDAFGADFPIAQVRARRKEIGQRRMEGGPIPVKPGAREVLEHLKRTGIVLALATSTHYEQAAFELKKAGLFDFFQAVVTGEMVEKGKPEPDIFLRAVAESGCRAEECIVVEDTENGARGGIAAGCRTILVPDMKEPGAEIRAQLFRRCDSLFDLIPVVDQLLAE